MNRNAYSLDPQDSPELNPAKPVRHQAPKPEPEQPPTCVSVPLCPMPDNSGMPMHYCPLPLHQDSAFLRSAMEAAPQFKDLDADRLLSCRRGNLQVILLAEDPYYARQAAVYLATLNRLKNQEAEKALLDQTEDALEVAEQLERARTISKLEQMMEGEEVEEDDDEDDVPSDLLHNALTVVSPRMLDPNLDQEPHSVLNPQPMRMRGPRLPLGKLNTAAVLVAADSGSVVSEAMLEQIRKGYSQSMRAHRTPPDLFITVLPGQLDRAVMDQLCFELGFVTARVGRTTTDYLCRHLRDCAEDLMMTVPQDLDIHAALSELRTFLHREVCEEDMERLILWKVQRQDGTVLTADDLRFHSVSVQKKASLELEEMVGLEGVKEKLLRLLAVTQLENRRRQEGKPVTPSCKNLAFAGPPGTGKSVTARLLARVLQEEGCGTGRFVEAGREQLVGAYQGHTSPQVAQLFEQARGGVLFLDEIGALIDPEGRDSYATEAVNALVRHMELEPETMVIFATYPEEMKKFMATNAGLSSRVAQTLEFPGYNDSQLWDILGVLAGKEGYELPAEAHDQVTAFFHDLRLARGDRFGNGREARRLFQAAVEELALRVRRDPSQPADLTAADLEKAAAYLKEKPEEKRPIGFSA